MRHEKNLCSQVESTWQYGRAHENLIHNFWRSREAALKLDRVVVKYYPLPSFAWRDTTPTRILIPVMHTACVRA